MSVDLPAPFSPHRAWTSPARNSRLTLVSALAPPNDLLTPVARAMTGEAGLWGSAEAGLTNEMLQRGESGWLANRQAVV